MWRRAVILAAAAVLSACGGSAPPPTRTPLPTPAPSSTPEPPSALSEREALILLEADDEDSSDTLAAVDMDTGETRALIPDFTTVTGAATFRPIPAVSPDGTTIAFARDVVEQIPGGAQLANDGIWLADLDGRNMRQLVAAPETMVEPTDGLVDPQWSPDGTRIVYTQQGHQDTDGIYVVSADGGDPTLLIQDAEARDFEWSPDGTRALYTSLRWVSTDRLDGIYIYDFETQTETQVISEPDITYDTPEWSPDGTRITYVRQGGSPRLREIYVLNVDGTGATNLTPGAHWHSEPQFSSDGAWVVYNHYDETAKTNALTVVTLDGSAEPRTVLELAGTGAGPSW